MVITFSIDKKTLDLITKVEKIFFGTITKRFPVAIKKICNKTLELEEQKNNISKSYYQCLTKVFFLIEIYSPK